MALRPNSTLFRSVVSRLTRYPTFATSTTPKMKPHTPSVDLAHHPDTKAESVRLGAYVPVYVAVGMILLQLGFGAFTVVHQLKWAPNVFLKKSRRETLPELVEPELVAAEGNKFIKGSFFRKIAHIQDFDNQEVMNDPIRGDALARQPRAVSLKDVGVDPVKDTGRDPKSISSH